MSLLRAMYHGLTCEASNFALVVQALDEADLEEEA